MMFYTTIGGWLLLYTGKMAIGEFKGLDADGVTGVFTSLLGQPVTMTICMILVVVLCFGIVCMGLQKGVEQITKKMMILLFRVDDHSCSAFRDIAGSRERTGVLSSS